MRGRHVDDARATPSRRETRDVEALRVDADRHERGARRLERLPRPRVVRLLERHRVAGIEQETGDDAERLL